MAKYKHEEYFTPNYPANAPLLGLLVVSLARTMSEIKHIVIAFVHVNQTILLEKFQRFSLLYFQLKVEEMKKKMFWSGDVFEH